MTALANLSARLDRSLRTLVSRHGALLSNAGALAAGTVTTAVLGFAYWWVAARVFPPRAIGYAAAAMSMINLLAHVGEFGMGPFLIGHRARSSEEGRTIIVTALTAVVATCVLTSLFYLAVQRVFATPLGAITDSVISSILFVGAVALTGFTLVFDQALVGLLRSGLQMSRNVVASVGKLGLLSLLAFAIGHDAGEGMIFDTWILGQALSLGVLAIAFRHRDANGWPRPKAALLRPLFKQVLGHHVLNIVLQAPALALPFIVTVVLSPAVNAAFFTAWSLVAVAVLVPASLATVLYSTVAKEPAQLAARLKLSLGISCLSCAAASGGFFLFSEVILGLFSSAYPALAGPSLQLLGFGTFGIALKYHYVAVQRLRGRLTSAALWLGLGACGELALTTFGGRSYGLTGLTCGWLAAVGLEILVITPTLLSAVTNRLASPYDTPATAFDSAPFGSEVA